MKFSSTLFIIILLLGGVIYYQHQELSKPVPPPPPADTVVKIVEIHDTVIGKPKFIKGDTDTLWIVDVQYVPDTNYDNLLQQYKELGNKHFSTNIFKNSYKIDSFGYATVVDTIHQNSVVGTKLQWNIKVPEKTITIIQRPAPRAEWYIGPMVTASPKTLGNSVNVSALYKDKQNRYYAASLGWNGSTQLGLAAYFKIK